MQKAVMAARAANLDVDDDTAIPTLHWPPDPPVINTASSTAGTTPAASTTAGATAADTPPAVTGIVGLVIWVPRLLSAIALGQYSVRNGSPL